ncbi:MAG: FAA hydrolase family protein [Gemmatimonadetes bacterium]|nr:FAA hydrolase family protein [Gemmatimonadota bacterium]
MQRPGKILCVGRNYAAHAKELGNELPPEPLVFLKPSSSMIQNGEEIVLPPWAGRIEYEGEIAVVIGRPARNVSAADAWKHVSGIVPLNDVTARELQKKDGQWARAKGFDTFCAVGTPVPPNGRDPKNLEVITRVNGQVKQHGKASDMAFSIPYVIAWCSSFATLEEGDLITTGTPEGVGPLTPGDVVEVEIPGVGVLTNPVVRGVDSQPPLRA